MSRRAASSAIDLILRRRGGPITTPKSSSQIGHHFYSMSRNFTRQGNPFSPVLPRLDLNDAFRLFDEMVRMHPQPSVFQYSKLLSVAVKTKHYSFALYMFDEMRVRGAPMDVYTFTIAINIYCLQKRVDYGFGVMSIILKSGYEPNVATFTTLIKGLFSGDRPADAVNMLENLLDLGICTPNERMISTMIDGLCKAGVVVAAHHFIRIAENTRWRIDVHAYNALLNGFYKERMIKEAEELLQYMKEHRICPNIVTYNTRINGYRLQGDLRRAKRLFDSLADTDVKPDIASYNTLIGGYYKHGRLVEARLLFGEVPFKGLDYDRRAYNIMIYGSFRNDKFAQGWKFFNDMKLRGISPDIFTYTILLDGLCRNEEIGEALLLLHTIEREGAINPNVVTYNVILRGLLKKKWLHESKLVLEVMYERGFSLSSNNLYMLRNQVCGFSGAMSEWS